MQTPFIVSTEQQAKAIPKLIAEFSRNWEFKLVMVVSAIDNDGIYYKFILKFETDDMQLYVDILRDGSYTYTSTF